MHAYIRTTASFPCRQISDSEREKNPKPGQMQSPASAEATGLGEVTPQQKTYGDLCAT